MEILGSQGHRRYDTHRMIHAQVCYLIRTDGHYIDDVTSKYFAGVHRWLPIMSRKRFERRLRDLQSLPTADFSILLLCMRLITQHPSSEVEKNQDRETLYLATKTLFTQVQCVLQSSLYLIQAGILIAAYEEAHGMTESAYLSIGNCSRMAIAAGLHRSTCSNLPRRSDAWFEEEERYSTFWGLVIRDRYVTSLFI